MPIPIWKCKILSTSILETTGGRLKNGGIYGIYSAKRDLFW